MGPGIKLGWVCRQTRFEMKYGIRTMRGNRQSECGERGQHGHKVLGDVARGSRFGSKEFVIGG